MVKFYGPQRRRRFDEDADSLPPKNRPLVLKQPKAWSPIQRLYTKGHRPKGQIKSQNKRQRKRLTRKILTKPTLRTTVSAKTPRERFTCRAHREAFSDPIGWRNT